MSEGAETRAKPHSLHGENALYVRPEQLSFMIQHGFDINAADSQGWTPLIASSRVGAIEIVQRLLEQDDLELEEQTDRGWRALHHAIDAQHADVVSALVPTGKVDIDARINGTGDTPLHLASRRGDESILTTLATAGAELELTTQGLGQTALHLAVTHGHVDIVERLILHGANVGAIDDDSASPFQLALFHNHDKIQTILRELGKAENDDFNLKTLMHSARSDQTRNVRVFKV